jgi:protein TonB
MTGRRRAFEVLVIALLVSVSASAFCQITPGPMRGAAQDAPANPQSAPRASVPVHLADPSKVPFATCISCPAPEYTKEARKKKVSGHVLLRVLIGIDGMAREIEVVKMLGSGLDEQAVAAVKKWRFKPASGPNGQPVESRTAIDVGFRLP